MEERQTISVPMEVADELKRLKSRRPVTDAERLAWRMVGLSLEVPKDWTYDDEACAFVRPKGREDRTFE